MREKAEIRRYAKALAAQTHPQQLLIPLREGLGRWQATCNQHPELLRALLNPAVQLPERRQVLAQVGEQLLVHPLVQRVMVFLLEGGRLAALPELCRELEQEADRLEGRVRVKVRTARPLTTEQQARLNEALTKRLQRQVLLEQEVQPELLGGLMASFEDFTFDGSVRHRLQRLGEMLRDEAEAKHKRE